MNPQSLNRYSYCLNNPINLVDPTGHKYDSISIDDYSGYDDFSDMGPDTSGFGGFDYSNDSYSEEYSGDGSSGKSNYEQDLINNETKRSNTSSWINNVISWTRSIFSMGIGFVPGIGNFIDTGRDALIVITGRDFIEGEKVGRKWGVVGIALPIGGAAAKKGSKALNKSKNKVKEIVERWMSLKELESTRKTGLMRGGRKGVHHVTDVANTNPNRARQRLSLDNTPEVRVRMEVPAGKFSTPSKVDPAFNMPGGGLERKATGKIPVNIIGVFE